MTGIQPAAEFFTAGGTLPPDAPSYLKRTADEALFQYILAGEFCYVLTPRQMGKSSLMIRTAQRLGDQGVKSAVIDLTQIGTVESEDQWYKGILARIKRRLQLTIEPVSWWEQKQDIPSVQKFVEFFEETLSELEGDVVVFIDEIDTTLKLEFRDNFFAGIRAIYNARAENPDFRRITFVLLGVASPSDLIKDRNRTPFNIGKEVSLKPFSRSDALMFEKGLEGAYPGFGRKILDRIFYWTNGHPYLTQKLCQSAVENKLHTCDEHEIDRLVHRLFISEEASRETNLQFVRDNVLNYPEPETILGIYKRILRGRQVPDSKNSLHQNQLKLSGLAMVEAGRLVVSNQIYRQVFDLAWANKYTEINWPVITSAALGLLVVILAFVIYHDAMALPRRAQKNIDNLAIYRDDRGIRSLADLFQMKPYAFPNEYEYKAKDTFFNTFRLEEQLALIEIEEPAPRPEEYKAVVAGLYTSLADVERSGQTTRLLAGMQASLGELDLQDDEIYKEITSWIEAREWVNENNPQAGLQGYSQAIGINPQNPATRFERARVYLQLGRYEEALRDFEQVIAIIPESNIEPTQVPTSAPQAGDPGTDIATFVPTQTGTIPVATGPASPSGVATVKPPVIPSPTNVRTRPSVGATPTRAPAAPIEFSPVQPRFLTLGQRIAAVKEEINRRRDLIVFLSQVDPADYPNLEERGLLSAIGLQSAYLEALQPGVVVFSTDNSAFEIQPNETAIMLIGDRIEVDSEGRARLEFPALLEVEFFRSSEARLVVIEQGLNEIRSVTLQFTRGSMRVSVNEQSNVQVVVETDTFVAATVENGTEFFVSSVPAQGSDISVVKGTVEIESQGQKQILQAGEATGGP